MSLSILSRQDIERWVPEPAPSKGGAGFIAKLFTTINRAMASLTSVLTMTKDGAHRQCRNDFERFFLWGQGLSVVDGNLDEVLAYSKELHFRVLTLLLRLGTVVLQGLSRDAILVSSGDLTGQCDDLRTLLDMTETILLQEPESDDFAGLDALSDSDGSDYGTTEIVEEISIYVDCLLDLSPSLDNPVLDIQVEGSDEPSTQDKESFNVSSEEALIYCRKIRDRFEALPKFLAERLAEANVLRAATLRDMRSQPIKYEVPVNDGFTESLFSATDQRLTEGSKSTVPSSSIFSSHVDSSSMWSKKQVDFDDNTSDATFASFSSATSAAGQGRPRVPPMPESEGNGFDCPICLLRVTNVKSRKTWKKHVYDDLKPYVCTAEECEDTAKMYSQSGLWAQHEASHLSSASRPPECSFCSANYRDDGAAYYRHLSSHLREVSLSVLPQPVDDDHELSDTDDSGPRSSVSEFDLRLLTGVDEANEPIDLFLNRTEPERPRSPSLPETSEAVEVMPRLTTDASASKDALDTEHTEITDESASQAESGADLNSIIDRLVEVRDSRPGKQVQLLEAEIRWLCTKAREVFIAQPVLLELEAPLKIVGDIHGQYYDLLRCFSYGGYPPEANYLFLGNYVDHGRQSLETICLILAYKIKYPENFFLLRGNHECASINRIEGFYDECKERYNVRLWKTFTNVFDCMPIAAIVDEKIFCMHGGLSPDLNSMEQLRRIMRPTIVPDCGLLCDLLWSDPDPDIEGWSENEERGLSFTFGPDVVARFLMKHDLDLVVRGHQVVEDGYEFFAERQMVTLWGAPNYKGEYDNAAAILIIDESLFCTFQILKPAERKLK